MSTTVNKALATAVVAIASVFPSLVFASGNPVVKRIDSYLTPYVQGGNFSGVVLVKKRQKVIFQKAYGFADRDRKIRNTPGTQFHIASISMQFTAGAVLRLVDQGLLTPDTHVGEFLKGVDGGEKITIRDLLVERSGLTDINGLPDYNDLLQHHQTPATLVAKIEGHPLLFEPGSRFLHEEHSAYNLLALIVEKKTGRPFDAALEQLVLRPAGLRQSGSDDDALPPSSKIAIGYEPVGMNGLKRASTIHWSGKTGNASVYATVADEARLIDALFVGHLLSPSTRQAVLEIEPRIGYGWFRATNKRFDQTAYYMNGRAPGFSSFVLYLPRERLTVVAFSNVYSSATTNIGNDVAAIALGLPYTPFQLSRPLNEGELSASKGKFQFGPDFYQPNAQLESVVSGSELSLRWPSGEMSSLIPLGQDRFVDRSYWEEVKIDRNAAGHPGVLNYGRFRGSAIAQ